jgi:hypothetical protein
VNKNHIIQWTKESWKELDTELIPKSFKICGIGVNPIDKGEKIYWKELSSLKKELEELEEKELPSISSLLFDVFGDVTPREPSIVLFHQHSDGTTKSTVAHS